MKKRFLLVSLACAGAIAGGAASPAAPAHQLGPAAVAKTCSTGFRHAVIGGAEKCLHGGEYCAVRYRSQYLRYGYDCYGSPARLHRR
jgi:hypothetical protein